MTELSETEVIRRRWKKATSGPWNWNATTREGGGISSLSLESRERTVVLHRGYWLPRKQDRVALAAAPADVAYLLKQLDAANAERAKLRKALQAIADVPGDDADDMACVERIAEAALATSAGAPS